MLCIILFAKYPIFTIILCLFQAVSLLREEEIENNAYRAYAYDTKPPVSQFQGVLEEKDKFMEKREKFLAYDHLNNLTKVPR